VAGVDAGRGQHQRLPGERWLLAASYASVSVALLLIALKCWAWLVSGSASMLGSLIDSVMDSMASLVSMLAVRYSLRPADADHGFGHGKAEPLAALAQSAFIFGSALLLLLYCVERLLRVEEEPMTHTGIALLVCVVAIVCTLGLVALQSHAIRLTGSAAIRADRLHYHADLLMNVVVIVSLLCARLGYGRVDIVMGVLIALLIGSGAVQIGREALNLLMDKALPDEVVARIRSVALSIPGVLGLHDLRTRRSGLRYCIQCHVEIADHTTLLEAHAIADAVEERLEAEFPGADVIIHQDPRPLVAQAGDFRPIR
jgi:ferrous-iron efflux pump FieF